MFRNKIVFSLLLCLFSLAALADITVKLQAPRQAIVGQRMRISYVVNSTDVEDIQIDDIPGFEVLYGPSTSTQSSFTMVNGKTSQNCSTTLSYMLQPLEQGTFRIPAATIICGGKSYKSNSAEIEVLEGDEEPDPSSGLSQQQNGGASQSQSQEPSASASSGRVGDKDLFMTVTASKKRIYEQEAVLLTYKLFTLVNIQQIAGEMPQLDGFHVQEVDSKAQLSLKYERVDGRNYGTAVWRQYVLFPQKTGRMTVPSITFDTQIEVRNTSMDPFDIFFGGGSLTQVVKKSITTPSVDIEVLPLPEPKPENFSGAVGNFSISGSLTPDQLNANDAATLRLIVSGQGNMKLMKAPTVNFPKDFEVYDPKQDDKTVNTATGAKGNMVYDYIVVPRHGGKYQIPPVEFSYFDPEENDYKTLKTDSFAISVAKAKGGSAGNLREQEDLKVLNNDIRYIKFGDVKVRKSGESFFGSTTYWAVYGLLGLLFLILFGIFYRKARENANLSRVRVKKAGKAATKRLRNAAKLLKDKNANPFYDEVMRALIGYAADKLNLPTTDLNKDNVADALNQRNVDETLVNAYINVLSECEFARFAPGNPSDMMDRIYQEASDVITKLDGAI